MIKIRIRNDDHEIDLQFPISENKLYAKLAEIHAIEGKDAPQSAFVTEVYWPEELSMLKDRFANLDELNYLARRMESFDYHEYDQFLIGITKLENPTEKDLINLTFNLDHFTLCKDVSSYGKIGREYVMNTEGAVPAHDEDDPKYAAIGKALIDRGLAQITAKGLLIYNPFDELTEVYDGQTFPEYYYEKMSSFDALNAVADRYLTMGNDAQLRFKAILEAENIHDADGALEAADRLNEYELSYFDSDAASFFKTHVCHNLDVRFDDHWLDTLLTQNEGKRLVERMGASITDYGILSARGGHLFEPVPVEAPEAKELKTQAMTDEKLEVVEVLGQTALFTNGRVTQKELPDGLYKYDLREGESIAFATVEPSVAVNHAGTIITKEPIIFGEEGYIEFDDDSSPNFLGDHMSIEEFQNTDFSQDEDESTSKKQRDHEVK